MSVSVQPSSVMPAINRHVVEATFELFGSFDLPIAPARTSHAPGPEAHEGDVVVASVGYTADGLRGNLLMLARASLINTWGAVLVGRTGDGVLCDTLAELTNMLLGRLKNRLLAHAVVLSIAIPTSAIGRELRLFGPAEAETRWNRFGEGDDAVYVRLDGTAAQGFALADPPADAAGAPSEGDVVLF